MLFSYISSEFAAGPIGFIASVVTVVSFVLGAIFALTPTTPRISLGSWKVELSATHARLWAAILSALSLSLGSGVLVGKIFDLHWLAGSFAIPIASFVTSISIASIAGQFTKPWIQEVGSVRKHEGETDEWFIGITPLIKFTELCSAGIAWLVMSALALGLAEPWMRALTDFDRSYPDQGAAVLTGMFCLLAAGAAVSFGRQILIEAVVTVFTAQAGIRWADAMPVVQPSQIPPAPQPARPVSPPARPRRRRNSNTSPASSKDSGAA